MASEVLSLESKLAFIQELLSCETGLYFWHYSSDGHLCSASTEHLVLDKMFEKNGCRDYMMAYGRSSTLPLIMSDQLGLMWCAVFLRREETLDSVYVMGPVFNSDISVESIESSVQHYGIDLSWRESFILLMRQLPVVSSILFFQYALMLHCCVTGEKLTRSDLQFQKWSPKNVEAEPTEGPQRDRMQVWLAERMLLNMVREGDLNYQQAISNANLMSNGIRVSGKNPVQQALISCTTFTSLCVREAIQAGLSPDMAYSVGDSYIQSMVECTTISELRSINHAMYEDFIQRIHKHRTGPNVSAQIQACRDYIELNADQALTLEILSRRVGYSESHLSRKFKQEMGVSISTYIKYARIERAKLLLVTTTDPVSQIALNLHFCSSSHFSDVFQEITGQKPQQYRRNHQKI